MVVSASVGSTLVLQGRSERASLFRGAIARSFEAMDHGRLELVEGGRRSSFGRGDRGLLATAAIHDPRFWSRLFFGGTLGAAESYVDGDWDTDDLTAVVRVVLRNRHTLGSLDSGWQRVGSVPARVYHALRRNTPEGSRRNIRAHYDLGNDFFERMLDRTMTYSAGYFARPDATLEEASREKIARIARMAEASPSDRVLEIGTGWGALAMHLAADHGCQVTTTTLSREQARLARERIAAAGLSDRVCVVERDYRELEGAFDKIVSVEMIEAVGADHFETFFARCGALLADDGRLALQTITIEDQSFAAHVKQADFIKRHIFPGSCIPSVTELARAATAASDLRLTHLEEIGPHYARTLAGWRDNLVPHEGWVVERYGRAFWRMWMFYLAYCEAAFGERYLGVAQMVFEPSKWRTR
jgi:cyclopropane-fatty-acyl-phospholipid synthase